MVLGTILLYLPAFFFQFIYYDDNEYVFENMHVQAGVFSPVFLKWFLSAIVSANWHPLTLVSHALDIQLFGLWPGGHHLTSVLIHAVNAWLVFFLFSRMTKSPGKSFLIAALFAWHPVKVESVAWIAERKDVLSTFFMLLSLLAYTAQTNLKNTRGLILTTVFFIASLLCKSMYVTLPLILLLFDFWPLRRTESWKMLIKEKLFIFGIALLFGRITLLAQASGGAIHHFADYPPLIRFANIAQAYWDYIALYFWPAKLSIFYPFIPNAHILRSLLIGIILLTITVILFIRREKMPALCIGWYLFGLTLLPVIGIITIGAHWIACRYLYWPSLGLSIILVWGGEFLFEKFPIAKKIRSFLIAAILGAYLAVCSNYLSYWQNSYKLFQHATEAVPNNWIAHVSLRAAYGRDGNHKKAAEHLIEAMKIFPDITNRIPIQWLDFYYMGKLNWDKNQIPQAESFLREANRRLAQEKPENIYADSKPERDRLAVCLRAFDAKNPKGCVL